MWPQHFVATPSFWAPRWWTFNNRHLSIVKANPDFLVQRYILDISYYALCEMRSSEKYFIFGRYSLEINSGIRLHSIAKMRHFQHSITNFVYSVIITDHETVASQKLIWLFTGCCIVRLLLLLVKLTQQLYVLTAPSCVILHR